MVDIWAQFGVKLLNTVGVRFSVNAIQIKLLQNNVYYIENESTWP